MQQEKDLSEKESLELITNMINKVKDSYYDTGIGAIMWGSVIAICSLVRVSELHFNYRLPIDIYYLTLVAIIPQIFISIREKKERKFRSHEDLALDYIWLSFGICIFLLIHVNNSIATEFQRLSNDNTAFGGTYSGFRYYDYMSSLFLILYGLPTFITGGMCRFRPMFWGGILCWVCAIVCVYTPVKVDLLLTALSSVFAWLIPGIIMERAYQQYKKGEFAKQDV
jgi:hypothetical protein